MLRLTDSATRKALACMGVACGLFTCKLLSQGLILCITDADFVLLQGMFSAEDFR